jgi:hypothetical protein
MSMLERSATVTLPVDEAQKKWTAFTNQVAAEAKKQASSGATRPDGKGGADPGQVFFNEAGEGRTEVTIQLDPHGISNDDESTLNGRVDSYLDKFKTFAEQR